MYSTCLFCNQLLGTNEVVESFPVGRRLAFDQRLGRLWVICRKCAKWNLTPLEERWEAIETCERLFRDTRKRVSTDHVGLARLSEGLELVRIGEPQRPEFAAWRYGDVFTRRRKRAQLAVNVAGVAGLGAFATSMSGVLFGATIPVLGTTLMAIQVSMQMGQMIQDGRWSRRILGMVTSEGRVWVVRGRDALPLRLVPTSSDEGWGIELPAESGGKKRKILVEGPEALSLIARSVPHLTPFGGKREEVQDAVRLIEEQVEPRAYLRWIARNPKTWRGHLRGTPGTGVHSKGTIVGTLQFQGIVPLIAVEMAVNEENERRALEGELALLEEAWKDAEEIAAIADKLALPAGVEARLSAIRQSHDAS